MSIDTQTLRARLQQLRMAGLGLADLLQLNANRLDETGTPPPSHIVEDLRRYREDFANLTSLFYTGSETLHVPHVQSLAELERELNHREAAQGAIRVARTILQTVTRDRQPLASLDNLHTQASEMIATLGANLSPDQLQLFTEGRHPWCDLMRMIHDGGSLPDAEWTALNASIEISLGRSLAVAAARGRLEMAVTAESPADSTVTQVRVEPVTTEELPDQTVASSIAGSPPTASQSETITFESVSTPDESPAVSPLRTTLEAAPTESTATAAMDLTTVTEKTSTPAPFPAHPLRRGVLRTRTARPVKPNLTVVLPEQVTPSGPQEPVESTHSVFDDIEPISLSNKFSQPIPAPAIIPPQELPVSQSQTPTRSAGTSLSIFDEADDEFIETQTAARVPAPVPKASSPRVNVPSQFAERLLGMARFSDATGASASLAAMILNGPDSDRAELLPDLILHLIHEGRSGLAYHLSRCLEARAVRQRPFVPSWLIRTWTFGNALVFPKGQLAGLIQDELQSRPRTDLKDASPEWRMALSLLVRASTLRPAIIAPTSRAASLLRDFELQDGCVQLYNYCSRIGAYGERIQGVFPGLFKLSTASIPSSDQLSTLHSDISSWKDSSNTVPLKLHVSSPLFQKTGWSLRAGTSQRYPAAAFDWMNWQMALRIGDSLIAPVVEDRRSELVRVKADVDEITAKLSAIESGEGRRQFSQLEIRAYLRQATTFAQRWISLHAGATGNDSQNYLPQAAAELRTEIQNRHEPVLAELRALAADQSSFEVRMAVACLTQSVKEIHRLVDPNISTDIREGDPRHLLHAELLKISDLRLGTNWEPEADLPSLEEEILQFLSQPQPDWAMAFKMHLAQGNHHLAERIRLLSHWSNAEQEALQGILDSDRQRQRTDFARELSEVKTLLAESIQLDILKQSERSGIETRIERLGRIASSDNDVSTGVTELERVRELLVKRREGEADRIRSRLRQLNSPAGNEHEGKPEPGSSLNAPQSHGWVMDFDS